MNDPTVNYYDVAKAGHAYYEKVDLSVKGTGHKQFQRWLNANEYKYYPSGDRHNVDPYFALNQYKSFIHGQGTAKVLSTNDWKDLGPYSITYLTQAKNPGIGRIEDMYISPTDSSILYISSRSGGFWRSTDHGNTWEGTTDALFSSGVNTFTVSPTNSQNILINSRNASNGYSNGIYASNDGGKTWTPTPFNPQNLNFMGPGNDFTVMEVAYHPRVPNLVFVATSEGVFKSYDNLNTWTVSQPNQSFKEIAFHPTNDSMVYLYNSRQSSNQANVIYRSFDQGSTYHTTNLIQGNNNDRFVELSTSPQCPDCVWFASGKGVWVSKDKGLNFDKLSAAPEGLCEGFAVNDADTSNMLFGYVELYNSTNGGRTFTKVSGNNNSNYIHADLRNIKSVNGRFYAVTDGFLAKSKDGGVSWKRLTETGIGIRENYKLTVSQANHYFTLTGSQDNGSSMFKDNRWFRVYGSDGMESVMHPLNEEWFIISYQSGGRMLTKEGGRKWTLVTPQGSNFGDWEAPLKLDPNNDMTVYDFREEVWKSTNFGEDFVKLAKPFSNRILEAAIAHNNSKIMVVSGYDAIAKSTDGGVSFTDIKGSLPNGRITDIAFDPNNDDVFIVTYGNYQADNAKVFLTRDGGASWTNITYNLGSMPILSVAVDPTDQSNIYLGGEIGVYTMPMGQSSWSLFNTGMPNMAVKDLDILHGSNTLRAATWGRGLWEQKLIGREDYPEILTTSLSDTPSEIEPAENSIENITSKLRYKGQLSSVFVKWSADSTSFHQTIPMSLLSDSTWRSNAPLPPLPAGTRVFFKVVAVGSAQDTSETDKFNYEVKIKKSCDASGSPQFTSVFIENVSIGNINRSSHNTSYTRYNSPELLLVEDSTFTLTITSNQGFLSNNYAAWIDYNGDAILDASEQIMDKPNAGISASQSFTVPKTGNLNALVTLRVRLSIALAPSACGEQPGEVEDYLVRIIDKNSLWQPSELPDELDAMIYPNPNQGQFTIEMDEETENFGVRIYSLVGSLVDERQVKNQGRNTIQCHLPAGYYFVTVFSGERLKTSQIIITD
tara:strand:+ start:1127 stop:4288 length:3162 start_codon:yes stop_codon:yes gene_type:complete